MENQAKTPPLTNAQRVRRANAALIARGGRRIPDMYLQPAAAQALADLLAAGYAKSSAGVVSAAILDAHRKINRKT